MDRRQSGREKRVTSGNGSVQKGKKVSNGKPVGNAGGYEGRGGTSSGKRQGFGVSRKAGLGAGGLIVVILIALLQSFLGGGDLEGSSSNGSNTPGNGNSSGTVASGNNTQANHTVSDRAREKRTVIQGNGADTITLMVYMCGTDLESKYGMATADLKEMMNAAISDKINLIVETGGCEAWKTSQISSRTNQIYKVTSGNMECVQPDMGKKAMTDPATLTEFIQFAKKNYPADRYMLILWDHGGGSISGYGYDQLFPNGSMTLEKIGTALKNSDCTFDFVGFDACLMATLETAFMLEPYSDYMVASEETEPGCGWYYTNWLTKLSGNTSMPTVEIGQNIIDDFIQVCYQNSPRDKTTLSITDLAELAGTVPEAFRSFSAATGKLLQQEQYEVVSNARGSAREFAQSSKINQIDLIDFAEKMGTEDAKNLVSALKGCIKYNRTGSTMTNAYGLSIYFPYDRLNSVNSIVNTYEDIGMDTEYTNCIKKFASLAAGGQIVTNSNSSPLSALLGNGTASSVGSQLIGSLLSSFLQSGDFSSITGITGDTGKSWVDTEAMKEAQNYYETHFLDAGRLVITSEDSTPVLKLTDAEWDLVQNLELNVFVDDGEGFIDLGLDNVYEFTEEGDLVMEYDRTWLAFNGQIVSYYFLSEDRNGEEYTIHGRVPALLNGDLVDIMVVFDSENPYGVIAGARIRYEEETDTIARGLVELQSGDELIFLCDYYSYDGTYEDSYMLGDPMIVEGTISISNVKLDTDNVQACYRLTDIYNNTYWTETME